jgi:hypothetical protein
MAVLNAADRLTALEAVKRTGQPWPNRIIECLTQINEILMDTPATEANNGTVHTIVRRKTLAAASARRYYEGTPTVATQTDTVTEYTQMWQAISNVDAALADNTGDAAAFRKTEAIGILNGMGIQQARDLIYGSRKAAGGIDIDGFATRLAKIDNKTVFDAGGTGSNLTSLYIAALGERFLHLIYPRGFGTVGVKQEDTGRRLVTDATGKNEFPVYTTVFESQYGIALEDPRALIRIANIAADTDPEELILLILKILRRLPNGANTYVLYGNFTIRDIIEKAAIEKNNVIYTTEDPWGRPLTMLRNLRVRTVEAILDTETAVT